MEPENAKALIQAVADTLRVPAEELIALYALQAWVPIATAIVCLVLACLCTVYVLVAHRLWLCNERKRNDSDSVAVMSLFGVGAAIVVGVGLLLATAGAGYESMMAYASPEAWAINRILGR